MRDLWNKKKFGADVLCAAWFQILLTQVSQKIKREAEGAEEWSDADGLIEQH